MLAIIALLKKLTASLLILLNIAAVVLLAIASWSFVLFALLLLIYPYYGRFRNIFGPFRAGYWTTCDQEIRETALNCLLEDRFRLNKHWEPPKVQQFRFICCFK